MNLEEAWRKAYEKEKDEILVVYDHHAGFVAGADWKKAQTINKACEWLSKEISNYVSYDGEIDKQELLDDFRKAMEDKQ